MMYIYIMMKRTQLYLEEDLYTLLKSAARSEKRTVSSYVREALRTQVSQGKAGGKKALQALMNMSRFAGHGPKDLAKNYEKYLYDR